MDYQWCLPENGDYELAKSFAGKFNMPLVLARILINRGIRTEQDADRFFSPELSSLYDPFLIKDMDIAVERLIKAYKGKERIFIYGDYDVDGITSVSMFHLMFKDIGLEPYFYIPDRLKEGYGLSINGVEEAKRFGASLIISADCGITAVKEIEYASSIGIDVIVCDHHEPAEVIPKAFAVLDPKRDECSYPFKELAGVGVSFKLIQAFLTTLNYPTEVLNRYIDLVAVGSAADIVPLVDENRILVKKGLEILNRDMRVGWKALIGMTGLSNKNIGTGQIVFVLAPRINAVGRLGNAESAVRLLTAEDSQRARMIAGILELENQARKSIDDRTFKQAISEVEAKYEPDDDKALVLCQENWHTGVIGIVASRIAEKYHRPTIMISLEDGIGKGSARSIPGFDIFLAIKECEGLLKDFGGHKYAAGLTIYEKNLDTFIKEFQQVAQSKIESHDLIPKLHIDGLINLSDITPELISVLKKFAPFGPQNLRPVFASRNLEVIGDPAIVGKNHLKFKVRQNGKVFDTIGFNLGELKYRIDPGVPNLDMAYVIEENTWGNKTTTQLRIKDLK